MMREARKEAQDLWLRLGFEAVEPTKERKNVVEGQIQGHEKYAPANDLEGKVWRILPIVGCRNIPYQDTLLS